MKTILIIALFASTLFAAEKADQKTTTTDGRYQVSINLEKGLVVEIWKEQEKHFSIPTSQSRVGGGGGVSWTSVEWTATGKYAFIAHTPASKNLPNDHVFYARTSTTSLTERISDVDVIPVIKILKILPTPEAKPKDQKTSQKRNPPVDPFARKGN